MNDELPWAELQMRFKSNIIGTEPAEPKTVFVRTGSLTYVEPDGKTFSHHLSIDSVPDENTFDAAYLVRFCNSPEWEL